MRKSLYESYSINAEHFAVLLASRGINNLYGFNMLKCELSDESCIYALESMTKLKIIKPVNGKMHINEPYDTMLRHITSSKYVIILRSAVDRISDYCLYISSGKTVLVTEISPRRKNSIVLTYIEYEDFLSKFLSGTFLPKEDDGSDEIQMTDEAFQIFAQLRQGDTIENTDFMLGVNIVDIKNKTEQSLIVLQQKDGLCLASLDDVGSEFVPYSRERFFEKLMLMLKG